MSFCFEVGRDTVWSPALRVGALYAGSFRAAAATFCLPSGLSDISSDMVDVDVPGFLSVTMALIEAIGASEHVIGKPLLEALAGPAVVMLDRAGAPVRVDDATAARWVADRRSLAAFMPA